jgi:hypothetical protein
MKVAEVVGCTWGSSSREMADVVGCIGRFGQLDVMCPG